MIKVSETLNNAINNFLNFTPRIEAHFAGKGDKHSGNDIMYSSEKTVNQRLNEMAIEGGVGTMYHDELLNRNRSGAHSIEAITGLSGQLEGIKEQLDTTLVFEEVTTDDTPVFLLCDDVDCEFVSGNGYIKAPSKTIAKLDISIIGINVENGGINIANSGIWHTTGIIANIGRSPLVSASFAETEVLRLGDSEHVSTVSLNKCAPTEWSVYVTGAADTTIKWRAEVKISNILSAD